MRPLKTTKGRAFRSRTGFTGMKTRPVTWSASLCAKCLERLNEDEREFVIVGDVYQRSQTEIAEALGCSQAHISRLEKRIRERLRRLWES